MKIETVGFGGANLAGFLNDLGLLHDPAAAICGIIEEKVGDVTIVVDRSHPVFNNPANKRGERDEMLFQKIRKRVLIGLTRIDCADDAEFYPIGKIEVKFAGK